jgi:hypothetical protein
MRRSKPPRGCGAIEKTIAYIFNGGIAALTDTIIASAKHIPGKPELSIRQPS